jgi:hypothetical protein
MKPKLLMISGFTKHNRHQVTTDVNDAILAAGGWVMNHTLFSNIAVTIQFALPAHGFEAFLRQVAKAGVHLDAKSEDGISQATAPEGSRAGDITTTLNITFLHDEPDLRREVPAV